MATPVAVFFVSTYHIGRFELCVIVSEAAIAAVSLICVSRNLYKYGIRKFLFVDQYSGEGERFQNDYVRLTKGFFRLLLWWLLPCLMIKTAREINRAICIYHGSAWKSIVVLLASIVSWVYLTIIFLSSCILFNLVFNLQVVHFEDYSRLIEGDSDTIVYLEEHARLRYNLSKISHRFRAFLILLFLFITISQCMILFQTTGYREIVNFTTAGNLAVSSIVQLVGVVLCLHSAAKISHRAQGVSSVVSKWHAWVTCSSNGASQSRITNGSENLEVCTDYSESDLESLDNCTIQTNSNASSLSSYHKRQALITYLQSNPGGITIFGWVVDRALINTVFFIELSLVLFVLGKTIVFVK